MFNGQEVRFVGTPEKPEWVARDIVAVLYPDADPWWREVATLYEPGLYCVITRSNSPLAIPFQKWLYEEVLPSITWSIIRVIAIVELSEKVLQAHSRLSRVSFPHF